MSSHKPPLHLGNLMILLNTLVGLSRLWLYPIIAIISAILIYEVIPSYRLSGAFISMLAIIYGYSEEFLLDGPKEMAEEIYNDPVMQQMRRQPDSAAAIQLSDRMLTSATRVHRFVLRTVQSIMGFMGLLIGIIGDNIQVIDEWIRRLIPLPFG